MADPRIRRGRAVVEQRDLVERVRIIGYVHQLNVSAGQQALREPASAIRVRRLAQVQLVERAQGNMSKAARIAGVDRTTLYRLMEKHGLHRDTIITTR